MFWLLHIKQKYGSTAMRKTFLLTRKPISENRDPAGHMLETHRVSAVGPYWEADTPPRSRSGGRVPGDPM